MRWPICRVDWTTLGLLAMAGAGPAAQAAPPAADPSPTSSARAEYGTIKGRLVWGGAEAPPARLLVEKGKAAKDPEICAREEAIPNRELVVDPSTKGISHGFAYLVRPKGANPEAVAGLLAAAPKVELDQRNCEFMPYSLAIHQGQKLLIKSSDAANHNVRYNAFSNPAFNQILPPQGQVELSLIAERRPILVACDIHVWMKAWLMVFDHPFFAVTGKDGGFEIKGVPAGDQNLVVWQEKVGYAAYTDPAKKPQGLVVKVAPGEVTDVGEIKIDPAKVK